MFGFFKKKKIKPLVELTLQNLTEGATLEYDLKTWVVDAVYEYIWENNFKSREYKFIDGITYFFLDVDEDGIILMSKPAKLKHIAPDFKQELLDSQTVPENIVYKNDIYKLREECFGSYRKIGNENWSELTSWMYWNTKDEFICIEQWSKFEFEGHLGSKINPFSIDNLLPGNN